MISFIFGRDWMIIDLLISFVAEIVLIIFILVGIAMFCSWISDLNKIVKMRSNSPKDYGWNVVPGPMGPQGMTGPQGRPGKDCKCKCEGKK